MMSFAKQLGLAIMALLCTAGVVRADTQVYCTMFAKDMADRHHAASAAQWEFLRKNAYDTCLLRYAGEPPPLVPPLAPVETGQQTSSAPAEPLQPEAKPAAVRSGLPKPVAPVKPVARKSAPPSKPVAAPRNLVPGSEAWNIYCAKKYSSFNKLSGTYLSRGGKIKRCAVP